MAIFDETKATIVLRGVPSSLEALQQQVQKCLDDFDLRQAKDLARQLEIVSVTLPISLRTSVQGIITRLRIQALPLYHDQSEILKAVGRGLGQALHYDTPDVIQRVRAKLLDYAHTDRDQVRQDLITTMTDNEDVLTVVGPNRKSGQAGGTIKEWLANYNLKFGTDPQEDITVAGYLFSSAAIQQLPVGDREAIGRLIHLYEFLKLSSLTAIGIEEDVIYVDDTGVKDLNHGRPITLVSFDQATVRGTATTTTTPRSASPKPIPAASTSSVVSQLTAVNDNSLPASVGLAQEVDRILRQFSMPSLDEVGQTRMRNIVSSGLRGVRNDVATKEILMRSTKLGGLGFDVMLAEQILDAVRAAKPQVQQGRSTLPPLSHNLATEKTAASEQLKASPLPMQSAPTQAVAAKPTVRSLTTSSSLPKPQLAAVKLAPQPTEQPKPPVTVAPKKTESSAAPVKPPTPPVTASGPVSLPLLFKPTPSTAPSMVDVQGKPPVAGPIDELHLFTLTDFRRLSPNAKQATARLREKIKLLEEDSYAKMTDGVQAWRSSPLNALYLALVNESLTTRQPIASIISGRQATGQSTLTSDEFAAIRELNQQLKF